MRALLITAFSLIAAAGCDSNSAGGSAACAAAGLSSTGTMTATVGTDAFEAVCVSGQVNSGVLSLAGIANLGETGANQRQINLTIPGAAVGSASLNPLGGGIASFSSLDIANPTDTSGLYTGLSGTADISALSATAATGTFSFRGRNNAGTEIEVASGRFDITF